jgi:hypothetical protein
MKVSVSANFEARILDVIFLLAKAVPVLSSVTLTVKINFPVLN